MLYSFVLSSRRKIALHLNMTAYEYIGDPMSKGQVIGLMLFSGNSINLSVAGSSAILFYAIRHGKWREGVYFRLLMGLSVADLVISLQALGCQFSFPREIGLWMTFGNQTTCMVSAYFSTFLLAVVVYSFALSSNYVAKVCFHWRDDAIRKWIEIPGHILAWALPICLSTALLLMDSFSPVVYSRFCSIADWPNGCIEDETIECQRGNHPLHLLFLRSYIYFIFSLSLIAMANTIAVAYIATKDLSRGRYNNDNAHQRTRALRTQAIYYCLGFANTFLWAFLNFAMYSSLKENPASPANYAFVVVFSTFYPLQGFINAIIFLRPRVERLRKKYPGESLRWAIKQVIFYGETTRGGRGRPQSSKRNSATSVGEKHDSTEPSGFSLRLSFLRRKKGSTDTGENIGFTDELAMECLSKDDDTEVPSSSQIIGLTSSVMDQSINILPLDVSLNAKQLGPDYDDSDGLLNAPKATGRLVLNEEMSGSLRIALRRQSSDGLQVKEPESNSRLFLT